MPLTKATRRHSYHGPVGRPNILIQHERRQREKAKRQIVRKTHLTLPSANSPSWIIKQKKWHVKIGTVKIKMRIVLNVPFKGIKWNTFNRKYRGIHCLTTMESTV